jgi:hypothetical protein
MKSSKPILVEPLAEQIFKHAGRLTILGVLAFAAAHLEGPAEALAFVLVVALLLLAMVAMIEGFLDRALPAKVPRNYNPTLAALLLVMTIFAIVAFMSGWLMVLPFSG